MQMAGDPLALATAVGRIHTDNYMPPYVVTYVYSGNLSQGALLLCWSLNLSHPYKWPFCIMSSRNTMAYGLKINVPKRNFG